MPASITRFTEECIDLADKYLAKADESLLPILPNSVWGWGNNSSGSLGLGDITPRSSPVQIGSLTDWKQIDAGESVNGNFAVAVKTNGTLWSWGGNAGGQLGSGTITARSSPVQVGSLTDWNIVSAGTYFCAAIKTNGTLWTWGVGTNGVLGSGNITSRSSPVQVGSDTNWAFVFALPQSCFAIKTTGTLWAWGRNSYGALGLGDIVHRSSPVQVGSLTNWLSIGGGSNGSDGRANLVAIKTDGTLWTWGRNDSG